MKKEAKIQKYFIIRGAVSRAIIFVCFFYLVLYPFLHTSSSYANYDVSLINYLLLNIKNILIFIPLLIFRKRFTIINPLILLILIGVVKMFIKKPFLIFEPFTPYIYTINYFEINTSYEILSPIIYSISEIKMNLIIIISLIFYYVGYFSVKHNNFKKINFNMSLNTPFIFFIVSIFFVFINLIYILQFKGGFNESLLSWQGGRGSNITEQYNWLIPFFDIPKYLMLILMTLKKPNRILIYFILIISSLLVFTVDGSRTNLFFPFLLLETVNYLKTRKIYFIRLIFFSFSVFLFLGILADFRTNVIYNGDLEFKNINNINDLNKVIEDNIEISRMRSNEFNEVLLFNKVPEKVDYLYGKTYIGSFLFFIPRAIWKNKPRGGGQYNARLILNKGGVGGVPISPYAELYWNFSYLGCIIGFFILGRIHRFIFQFCLKNIDNLIFILLCFIFTYMFKFNSVSIILVIQLLVPAIILLYALRKTTNKKIAS